MMMAAQYKARIWLHRSGNAAVKEEKHAVRLGRAVWAFATLFTAAIPIEQFGFQIIAPGLPVSTLFALISVSLAQIAWLRIHRILKEAGVEVEQSTVSVGPWMTPVQGGMMAGVGGSF